MFKWLRHWFPERPPPYRFPAHIEAVNLDAGLLGLHIDAASQHRLNPACESGTRKISKPKTEM